MGKKGEKQFRWSRPMERLMLEILADEVKLGNRPNNNFKPSSFTRVVDAIKDKFEVTCLQDHVENHLRTVRSSCSTIVTIRGKRGFGWDDNLKMVTASLRVYHDYVQKCKVIRRLQMQDHPGQKQHHPGRNNTVKGIAAMMKSARYQKNLERWQQR